MRTDKARQPDDVEGTEGAGELATVRGGGGATADVRRIATRKAILEVAVRLFAEQGVLAVSNRQIGAAAGKGNTSVVGYYFTSKADLVRALMRQFNERIEVKRQEWFKRLGAEPGLRDWVACLVHPYTEQLDEDGPPTWHARFIAQVVADPGMREITVEEASSESVARIRRGLSDCLPGLSDQVLAERTRIVSHVIVQMCAERERALAEGTPVQPASWEEFATGLVDVLVGMWTAAVTTAENEDAFS
ncbi:TetR/AcrR family transcriptional regulator [Amycolatopsis sp. RTGN1]|uniref:TetR/AcrR family transcriptional regulator n=1 Tax=Amycolatopsis ponsaeliensis TaxID=2992142 RepID=UPI00254C62D0|nr:TetR/AcrR family transcriptional regulator [Amycolatopsis sp. RTGN1]